MAARISAGLSTPWSGSGRSRSMSRISLDLLDLGAELAVELVAADPGEVVALGVEEGVLEVGAGRLDRRAARPGGPACRSRRAPLHGWARGRAPSPTGPRGSRSGGRSARGSRAGLLVVAEGAQQDEQAEAALAGHAGAGGDVLARLGLDVELDPLAAVGVDGAGDDGLGVAAGLEDDARASGRAGTRRRARCR